jgi:hypothetical protein
MIVVAIAIDIIALMVNYYLGLMVYRLKDFAICYLNDDCGA